MERKLSEISNIRLIAEIGLMAAIGFVLDELAGALSKGLFPNGGAIGIAMVAVLIMSYRRGLIAGLSTGLIMGLLDLATGPFMIASDPFKVFLQVSLDYVLPYFLMGFAGLVKKPFDRAKNKGKMYYLFLGILIAGLAKLLSHYLAGILFWADPDNFAWNMTNVNPYLYCFLYNAAFTIPCMVLSFFMMLAIYKHSPQLIDMPFIEEEKPIKNIDKVGYIYPAIFFMVGITLFVTFLIRYVSSYYYDDYGSYGSEISFDSDMLVLWLTGLIMAIISIICLIFHKKGIGRNKLDIFGAYFILSANIIYALSRIIKCIRKGYDYYDYRIWIVVCIAIFCVFISHQLIIKKEHHKN